MQNQSPLFHHFAHVDQGVTHPAQGRIDAHPGQLGDFFEAHIGIVSQDHHLPLFFGELVDQLPDPAVGFGADHLVLPVFVRELQHGPLRYTDLLDRLEGCSTNVLAARLREIEDAEKTELQLARDRAAELEQAHAQATERVRAANLKAAVYDLADSLGLASASLALRAVDRAKVDWDDGDAPTNIQDLLAELAEEEPALKAKQPKTPRTNATGGAGGQEPPALTAEQLEWASKTGMTPDEYRQAMSLRTLTDWERSREKQQA